MTPTPDGPTRDARPRPGSTVDLPGSPRASSARQPALSSRLGPYELQAELGRGGMGIVFRARDPATGRDVALKTVLRFEADGLERFRREAQALAALDHPGIVKVHAAGDADGRPFLVCELIEGARPLDEACKGLPLDARARLVRDACRALGHAHAKGIVHRDIKASNLLVGADGRVRVTDFGLALLEDRERLTQTGTMLGTPTTMSPEQLTGSRAVGPRSDVWSLGVALYVALTGQEPFAASSLSELCAKVAEGRPTPPRRLSRETTPGLEAVCLRALTPAPAERWQDGAAMADALDAALRGERIGGAGRPGHVARWVAAGAAPLALVVAGVVAWPAPPPLQAPSDARVAPVAEPPPTRDELRAPALRADPQDHASLAGWTLVPHDVERLEVVVAVTPDSVLDLHVEVGATDDVTVAPEWTRQRPIPLRPGLTRHEVRLAVGWNVLALRPDGGGKPVDRRDVVRLPRSLDLVGGAEVRNRKDGSSLRLVVPGPPLRPATMEEAWHVPVLAPYFLGTYEVSWRQFRAYSAATGAPLSEELGQDDLPAVSLGERDLGGYCDWAGLRLPTATEWDHAAVDIVDGNFAGLPFEGPCAVTDTSIAGARARWGHWHLLGNVHERVQFIGLSTATGTAARLAGAFGSYFGNRREPSLGKGPHYLQWDERHPDDGFRVARGVGEGRGDYYKVRTD